MKDLLTASNRCPYCNKSFSNTGNLNKHLKLHTGERPHKCSFCGRGFTENYKLISPCEYVWTLFHVNTH